MPRRLTPRVNWRKEGWEYYERYSPSQKAGRGQLISGRNRGNADMDDLALWYALNQQMTNYWADVDYNGGSRAHEFYLPEALFAVGNNRFEGAEKSVPSMLGGESTAPPPRVTWSAIFGYSGTMRALYDHSG
jgi:hypothetical protein